MATTRVPKFVMNGLDADVEDYKAGRRALENWYLDSRPWLDQMQLVDVLRARLNALEREFSFAERWKRFWESRKGGKHAQKVRSRRQQDLYAECVYLFMERDILKRQQPQLEEDARRRAELSSLHHDEYLAWVLPREDLPPPCQKYEWNGYYGSMEVKAKEFYSLDQGGELCKEQMGLLEECRKLSKDIASMRETHINTLKKENRQKKLDLKAKQSQAGPKPEPLLEQAAEARQESSASLEDGPFKDSSEEVAEPFAAASEVVSQKVSARFAEIVDLGASFEGWLPSTAAKTAPPPAEFSFNVKQRSEQLQQVTLLAPVQQQETQAIAQEGLPVQRQEALQPPVQQQETQASAQEGPELGGTTATAGEHSPVTPSDAFLSSHPITDFDDDVDVEEGSQISCHPITWDEDEDGILLESTSA